MPLETVSRKNFKIKINLSGVAGAGKTQSALLLAYGLTGDWNKIALIDTENQSSRCFAHLGPWKIFDLSKYSPEDYVDAIRQCEASEGIEVIIIDSITHEWEGKGGCLEQAENFHSWVKVTPKHNEFKYAILHSPCHIITTVRCKEDYVHTTDAGGKLKIVKVGLRDITRDGWEYEVSVNLRIDTDHRALASKDRTHIFEDLPPFLITESHGRQLQAWCNEGDGAAFSDYRDLETLRSLEDLDRFAVQHAALLDNEDIRKRYDQHRLATFEENLSALTTKKQVVEFYDRHKEEVLKSDLLKAAFKGRQDEIASATTPLPPQPETNGSGAAAPSGQLTLLPGDAPPAPDTTKTAKVEDLSYAEFSRWEKKITSPKKMSTVMANYEELCRIPLSRHQKEAFGKMYAAKIASFDKKGEIVG